MEWSDQIFAHRQFNPAKLAGAGFRKHGKGYRRQVMLPKCGFILTVTIDEAGQVATSVMDPATQSPYSHYDQQRPMDKKATAVRQEVVAVLEEVAQKAFEPAE